MIDVEVKLEAGLASDLDRYENRLKGKVLIPAAAAMARPVYEELTLNASGARAAGPGSPPGKVTGTLAESVYRAFSEGSSDDDTKVYHVSVNKKKAPHWHFLEYGTSRMPARPFIRPSYEAKKAEAIRAGLQRMRELLR